MDTLLFLVDPILWDAAWEKHDIYILLLIILGGVFLLLVGKYLNTRKTKIIVKKPKKEVFHYTKPEDPDYERKTLTELKHVLANLYTPNHTESHTVKEIGQYVFDSELIELAGRLEEVIYQGKTLREEERGSHNEAIKICLEKLDNFLKG